MIAPWKRSKIIGQFKIFQQATFKIPAASAPPQPISAEMEERIATQRCAGGHHPGDLPEGWGFAWPISVAKDTKEY